MNRPAPYCQRRLIGLIGQGVRMRCWPHATRLFRLLLQLLCLYAAGWATPGLAATYGNAPTLFNWVDTTAHTAVEWTGAAGGLPAACTGGYSAVDDDITDEIPIPFTFNFGGTNYSTVRIMSNGRLQFNNTYCYYGTQTVGPPPTYTLPYPDANLNRTMRIYGADFCPAGGGTGCSGTVTYGTEGSWPNQSFVVTWNNMREWNSGTSLFNVQIILYPNGEFVYQYKDVSNVSGGTGQIGYQLSATDYGLYDTAGITTMAYSAVRFFLPPATWGEYRLDECTGTTAGDSSGNGYNATLTNGPVAGSSGALCKGVSFDGVDDYVLLPAGFPHMSSSFTITAWINTSFDWTTMPQAGGQKDMRIFVDDQNNSGGYAFSLGDGGWGYDSGGQPAGRLRFFNRSLTPIVFDSPPVIRANTWYFVAAVTDFAANQRFIYVFDAAGNQLSQTSQISTGTWGVDTGSVAIGGEVNGAAGGEGAARWRFKGYIDEVKLFKSPLTSTQLSGMALNEGNGYGYDGYQRVCIPCATQIGRYNAFESTTAAGSILGIIKTKIAGSAFSASSGNLRVVAVNSAGTAIENISPTVNVTLLDASNDTQPLDTEACRSSWTTIMSLGTLSLTNGIATFDPTIANAYPNVRLRFDKPPPGAPTYGCTTDNFAIRPASLNVSASDGDWQTAGGGRTLSNTAATGGNVHAAGQPLTLTATARNSAGTTTTNYNGTPSINPAYMILPDPTVCTTCSVGTFSPGTWTASSGVLTSTTASYSDVGSFTFSLEDTTFAKVDQGDSTKAQRYITSNIATVGRFVPANYLLQLNTPTFQTFGSTCASRSFTYLGQPFGYAAAPIVTVTARNFSGGTTTNFRSTGGLWSLKTPLASSATTCTAPTQTCALQRQDTNSKTRLASTYTYTSTGATPGWDGSQVVVGNATLTSANDGTGPLSLPATDKIALYRTAPSPTPTSPFNATISLALQLDDFSEAGTTGNPASITGSLAATSIAFDSGNAIYFGQLHLSNAFGPASGSLALPVQAQYWSGKSWVLNSADSCTSLPATAFFLTGGVAATTTASAVTLTGGQGSVTLTNTGGAGSVDAAANLGASGNDQSCLSSHGGTAANRPWLRSRNGSCAATYDRDPSARATFGIFAPETRRSVHVREQF